MACVACGRETPRPVRDTAAAGAPTPTVEAMPELPPSIIELPVFYDLDPAVAALERAVPATLGALDVRRPVPGHPKLSYAFVAERSPFDVTVRGTTVTVSSTVTYRARAWYRPPVGPSVGGSCGISGDAPRIRITLRSTLRLANDWRVAARTQVPTVAAVSDEARDRCRLTILKLDVTERVVDAVRAQLEGKVALLDARIARMDVRKRVDQWWTAIGRPMRIGDGAWLELRPETVRLGSVDATGRQVVAPLTLSARPRIVTGPRPDSSSRPLPALVSGASDTSGLHLLLDASFGYDAATRALGRALVGRRFAGAGQSVVVRDVKAFSDERGRIALALRLGGDVDARVVLLGRPAYDSASNTLSLPDLDYAVADANVLLRGADQLGHDAFRDALRERARWPITLVLDSARRRAERALNREITRGVRLAGIVSGGDVVSVHAGPDAIHVRAVAGGSLMLTVRRAPTVARRPAARTATRD